jgi:hypothetical protein
LSDFNIKQGCSEPILFKKNRHLPSAIKNQEMLIEKLVVACRLAAKVGSGSGEKGYLVGAGICHTAPYTAGNEAGLLHAGEPAVQRRGGR